MDRTKLVFLIIGIVLLVMAGTIGFGQWQRADVEKRIVGTWSQDSVADLLQQAIEDRPEDEINFVVEDPVPGAPADDDTDDGGLTLDIGVSLQFREDHRVTIRAAGKEFHGRWSLSNARGKTKTLVARVMQTPTFEQRLIIHFEFEGKDRITVSDDGGLSGTFSRVQ